MRLERWRAERLWRRASELEAESRALALAEEAEARPEAAEEPPPGSIELSTAVEAALEGGMDPAAVARSTRLELALGALDPKAPSGLETLSARLCGIPDPPLAAAGDSGLEPAAFLGAFEESTANERYGLNFADAQRLDGGAEMRIYTVDLNWDAVSRPFRDRIAAYASVKKVAVVAEPKAGGGTSFEILADTRRSARVYGASLAGGGLLFMGGCGLIGTFIAPALGLVLGPLGALIGAAGAVALHRAIAAWAFPTAKKELASLARSLALRTGGSAGSRLSAKAARSPEAAASAPPAAQGQQPST